MTFCNQLNSIHQSSLPPSVNNLNISNNPQLSNIHSQALLPLENLQLLDVHSNNLSNLEVPPNVKILKLENNPWNCDCRLKQLQHHLRNQSSNAKCSKPIELFGQFVSKVSLHSCDLNKSIIQVSPDESKSSNDTNHPFIYTLSSVAVLSVLILILLTLSKKVLKSKR